MALDLFKVHYQVFLIIYLKLTAKGVKGLQKKNESVYDFFRA